MNQKNKKWGVLILAVLTIFLYGCSKGVITGNVIYDRTASSELKAAEANETPAVVNESSQNKVQEPSKNQTAVTQNQTKFTYNILAGSSTSKKTSSGGSSGGSSNSGSSSNIPDATEFSGDTTDFSQESDLTSVNDLVLEVPNSGKIDFSGQSVDISNTNLDAYVQISNNFISVDSNNLPELNKPATLTLYGLSFSNPVILQDDSKCTDCNIISYTNGDLTFTVQHFTNYTSQESGKPCAHVVDDLVVNVSAVLCAGTYNTNDANGDGILKIGANNIVLDCNNSVIVGNGAGYGIYSNGYNGNTIKNCNIKKYSKGIYLENSNSNILTNNIITNSTTAGIELVDASHNTISGNTLRFNTKRGINLVPSEILDDATSCKYNVIKNNIIESQQYGITLQNGNDYNNVTNNIVNYNSNAGIQITGNNNNNAVHNYVVGNNLTGNGGFDVTESKRGFYSGIYVGSAGLNYIVNNNVLNNLGPGIALFNSSSNEIRSNNVKNNAFEGVLLMNDIVPSRGIGNKNNIVYKNNVTHNSATAILLGYNSIGNSITKNLLNFGGYRANSSNNVYANNTYMNAPPVILTGDSEAWSTYNANIHINVSDPDNGTVNISVQNLPAGAVFINKTIIWMPNSTQYGDYNITLNANDGIENVSKSIILHAHQSCHVNSECYDGSNSTVDVCNFHSLDWNGTYPSCSNWIPNVYGRVFDTDTGLPIAGENISFYNNTVWNAENMTGNYSALQPKPIPDAVTDANGAYYGFSTASTKYVNIVIEGTDEKDFDHKMSTQPTADKLIILPETGNVRVLFEKAEAGLKSDLRLAKPYSAMLVANTSTGKSVVLNNGQKINALTEILLYIRVHCLQGYCPTKMDYDHYSNSSYAIVDRLDYDTWRIYFEDLDVKKSIMPDFDYNDAVILVELYNYTWPPQNTTPYTDDCDHDGIKNWNDFDDDWCDTGSHNSDVDQNSTYYKNLNVDGHIIYSGRYEGNNNYTCNEYVNFNMFGINNGYNDTTVTFIVENHTAISGVESAPIPCAVNGKTVYCGNQSKSSENLFLPNDNKQHNKNYKVYIPCNWGPGRYEIHAYDNLRWGKMHKLGDFFIIRDTTPPNFGQMIYGYIGGYLTEYKGMEGPYKFYYSALDPPQPGTLAAQMVYIEGRTDASINVTLDKDINTDSSGDGIKDNDVDYSGPGSDMGEINIRYNVSGHYVTKATATDKAGNKAVRYENVTVYMTENEADVIADPIYRDYFQFLPTDWGDPWYDVNTTLIIVPIAINAVWDRYDDLNTQIGDEYMTPGNNISTKAQVDALNYNVDYCQETSGGTYVKTIPLSTAAEFNDTIKSYLRHLKCVCHDSWLVGGPAC